MKPLRPVDPKTFWPWYAERIEREPNPTRRKIMQDVLKEAGR